MSSLQTQWCVVAYWNGRGNDMPNILAEAARIWPNRPGREHVVLKEGWVVSVQLCWRLPHDVPRDVSDGAGGGASWDQVMSDG